MEKKDFKSLGIKLPKKFKNIVIDYYRIDTDGLPIFHIVQDIFTATRADIKLAQECSDWLTHYMFDHKMIKPVAKPKIEDCDLLPGSIRFKMPFQSTPVDVVLFPVAI